MAIPTFRAAGTMGSGLGAGMSLGLPAGTVDDDYHLLIIGTYNQAITLYGGKEEGFTAIPGGTAGTGTGGSAGSIAITLFDRIRGTGATNAPVIGDSGAVQFARILAFTGQAASSYRVVLGTPGTQAATTSGVVPGGTTSTNENLIIVCVCSSGPDSTGTAEWSSPANASFDGAAATERADQATDDASGGHIGVITGPQTSAGVIGNTTFTSATSTAKAYAVISLTSGAAGGGGSGFALGALVGRGGLVGPSGLVGRGGGLVGFTKIGNIYRPKRWLWLPAGLSLQGA